MMRGQKKTKVFYILCFVLFFFSLILLVISLVKAKSGDGDSIGLDLSVRENTANFYPLSPGCV